MASAEAISKLASALTTLEMHTDVNVWLDYVRTEFDDLCGFDDVLVHHVLDVIEHVGDADANQEFDVLRHMRLPAHGVRIVTQALQNTIRTFTPI